jgi:glycosyltransferase involved in cell wall biosynthesis
MRPAVELGIAESGIRDNFTLEGEVANDSVLAAMRAANAMVHIAQIAPDGGRESFGVVLAEAAASGLPVIASRLGGIPEIVEDLTTGFLVEPGAYPEMAEHAAALLSNPALADRLGRQAHERASRCFNAEVQARQLDSFYDRLIAQSCGNSGSGCPPGFAST